MTLQQWNISGKLEVEKRIEKDFDEALTRIKQFTTVIEAGRYTMYVYYRSLFNK